MLRERSDRRINRRISDELTAFRMHAGARILRISNASEQWLTLSDGSILTRQEQFVLRQVAEGEIADLKQEFGEAEEDRRLRARFLEELLTGELPGVKIQRRGVRIKNAVVEEAVDLENAEVDDVGLNYCIFKEWVSFRDAYLENNLTLIGSHFLKEADFQRLKVAGANIFAE